MITAILKSLRNSAVKIGMQISQLSYRFDLGVLMLSGCALAALYLGLLTNIYIGLFCALAVSLSFMNFWLQDYKPLNKKFLGSYRNILGDIWRVQTTIMTGLLSLPLAVFCVTTFASLPLWALHIGLFVLASMVHLYIHAHKSSIHLYQPQSSILENMRKYGKIMDILLVSFFAVLIMVQPLSGIMGFVLNTVATVVASFSLRHVFFQWKQKVPEYQNFFSRSHWLDNPLAVVSEGALIFGVSVLFAMIFGESAFLPVMGICTFIPVHAFLSSHLSIYSQSIFDSAIPKSEKHPTKSAFKSLPCLKLFKNPFTFGSKDSRPNGTPNRVSTPKDRAFR